MQPILPRVVPPSKPLGMLAMIRTGLRNPIEAWPQSVYEEPILHVAGPGGGQTFVSAPELVQEVMVSSVESFYKSKEFLASIGPLVGYDSIVTSEGERWRKQRLIAAPLFRPDKILEFVPAIVSIAETTAARWISKGQKTQVDLLDEMLRVSLSITGLVMLSDETGKETQGMIEQFGAYLEGIQIPALYALLGVPAWFPMPAQGKRRKATRTLHSQFREIIARRRSVHSHREPLRRDLLDQLLTSLDPRTAEPLAEVDIANNMITFIAAGFETTATALAWTLYLLAKHPSVAEEAVAEIESVTKGAEVTAAHLGNLNFLRQVILESMRLYPPSPAITRTTSSDVSIGGMHLKAGASVMVAPYVIHRHKQLWDKPDLFDPGNFTPEKIKQRHRHAYLPFGAGQRTCIGMSFALTEMQVLIATLLRRIHFEPFGNELPRLRLMITLNPSNGLPISIEERRAS